MRQLVVSVENKSGTRQLTAEFSTIKALRDFIAWRIEELLEQGAAYVIVADTAAANETRYRASGIADCIFVAMDWRHARVQEPA